MAESDNLQQQTPPPTPDMLAASALGGGSPLGPVNPVQASLAPQPSPAAAPPQQQPPNSFSQNVSSVMGLPQFSQPMGQLSDIQRKEEGIRQQQANLPQPKWGPQIEQGKSFLHNLGQALLMVASATKPGAAIEEQIYAPGIRQYGAKRQALASQLETLKEQEAVPSEQLRATTGAAQAAGLAGYRSGMLGVAQQRAEAYSDSIQGRLQRELAQTAQGWQQLDVRQRQQAAQQWYQQKSIEERDKAIAAGMSENDARVASAQAIANAANAMGLTKEYPWMSIGQQLGIVPPEALPPAAQTPGGATPAAQPKPLPPAKSQAKGATPPRPKGVPEGAKWNPTTRRWSM